MYQGGTLKKTRQIKVNIGPSDGGTIVLSTQRPMKIVGFLINADKKYISTLIEIFWSDLTFKQQSSQIYQSALCRHSSATSEHSGLLRSSTGVPAEL